MPESLEQREKRLLRWRVTGCLGGVKMAEGSLAMINALPTNSESLQLEAACRAVKSSLRQLTIALRNYLAAF